MVGGRMKAQQFSNYSRPGRRHTCTQLFKKLLCCHTTPTLELESAPMLHRFQWMMYKRPMDDKLVKEKPIGKRK